MKKTVIFFSISILTCLTLMSCKSLKTGSSSPKIIAHRGFWQTEGSAQNSITALRKAQQLGIYGSEFDVWMTADNRLVINHDGVIDGVKIETAVFDEIKNKTLPNGETIPTLEEYLKQGKIAPKTKLILEIKTHSTDERNKQVTAAVIEAVTASKMENQVEYIAFSLVVCSELARLQPKAKVAYLMGDKTPAEIKALKLSGLDYNINVYRKKPEYIEQAHQLGLFVNVWTVSKPEDIAEMTQAGVDFITTDRPDLIP